MLVQEAAPLGEVIIADFFLFLFFRDDGKDEMEVGMRQFVVHLAGRAMAASICLRPLRAIQITGVGQGEGERSVASLSAKQLGMGDNTRFRRSDQVLLHFFLSDDISEIHKLKTLMAATLPAGAMAASAARRFTFVRNKEVVYLYTDINEGCEADEGNCDRLKHDLFNYEL